MKRRYGLFLIVTALSMTKYPNHFQPGFAMISIEWRKHAGVEAPRFPQFVARLERMNAQKRAERTVSPRDPGGVCVESLYDLSRADAGVAALVSSDRQIRCAFEGDFPARFSGTPELRIGSCEMLRTAQQVKGKS